MANEVQPCIDVASRQDKMTVVDYSSTDIGRPTVVQPDQSEPMVGMSFGTVEAAKSFYRQYAIRKGFGIKTRTSKKDTHKKIRYFVLACAQISMDAQGVASQLNSSGLLRTQGLIGGKWTDAYDGQPIEVCNPATGESIVNVACMGGRETNDAISAAYDAYGSWHGAKSLLLS